MVLCLSCKKDFEDYKELALHIQSSKKGHRKGKRWAAGYLLRVRQLDRQKLNGRVPLTEEQKENKRNSVRILSGESQYVITTCPKCKHLEQKLVPIEFIESKDAWRVKDKLAIMCSNCE